MDLTILIILQIVKFSQQSYEKKKATMFCVFADGETETQREQVNYSKFHSGKSGRSTS